MSGVCTSCTVYPAQSQSFYLRTEELFSSHKARFRQLSGPGSFWRFLWGQLKGYMSHMFEVPKSLLALCLYLCEMANCPVSSG